MRTGNDASVLSRRLNAGWQACRLRCPPLQRCSSAWPRPVSGRRSCPRRTAAAQAGRSQLLSDVRSIFYRPLCYAVLASGFAIARCGVFWYRSRSPIQHRGRHGGQRRGHGCVVSGTPELLLLLLRLLPPRLLRTLQSTVCHTRLLPADSHGSFSAHQLFCQVPCWKCFCARADERVAHHVLHGS